MAEGKATKRGPDGLVGREHIKLVAERSKAVTDAVFGKFRGRACPLTGSRDP